MGRSNVEPVEIVLHEVGRERQHEAIPVVDDPVTGAKFILVVSCGSFAW